MTPGAGPDFFVIGAQRAGTTRLCSLLDLHPGVVIPTKEPMYFQSEEDMAAKADWYHGMFEAVGETALTGDGSTYYSMAGIYPGTAARIYEHNPKAKIIYIVRHPLRRIESGWAQLLSVGHANSVKGFDFTLRRTDLLLDPSLYWRQLSEYRRYFPDEQIATYFFEDFVGDEQAVVGSCFEFLGVAPSAGPRPDEAALPQNASEGKTQNAAVVDLVRALPGYRSFKRMVPKSLKALGTEHFRRPVSTKVHWRDDTLAWVVGELKADTTAFLSHAGRGADFWPLP